MVALDPDDDTSSIEDEFQVLAPEKTHNSLPSKQVRDAFLEGIDLDTWDEWDKDLFYMNLKSRSIEELVLKYPQFEKADLVKLKEKRK